ncbi:hypothetical protein [Candidatus Chrysopegis kryptomonas]|uniref:Uncharacterized protein n=1 Tax=Candidatus Chryseopegocella kryptomonas TaxID=1633643 RepID=A0A0P1NYR9_9BACT|nr:hypothetical protein [Candidatus Chrysopegis kryptomonas]CUT04175.1 hypothetical protein JGI23_01658 [Candidatus Chrysopegis kryptomonas]
MDLKSWKEQFINYLQEKIKNNQINYESFNEAVKEYQDLSFEIQKILEYAYKNAKGKDKEELYKLYKKFSLENAGEMAEKLNKLGYALKNDSNYKYIVSALSDQAYRIMEKTRHAQRDEVQYMITRIFVVNKKQIPELLSRAFNPTYPDDLFKTFIYSFLSGILGETKGGEENE